MSSTQTKAHLGFIGAGWWATSNHMPLLAVRDDVELVGVCRLGNNELQRVKDRFGFAYATEDYLELLDNCELDGVIVASRPTRCTSSTRQPLSPEAYTSCAKNL